MQDRVREIVEALDATVPVEGAGVILIVDEDWEHDVGLDAPFLATPAGFVRFGLLLMKAAVAASEERTAESPPVDIDLDPILRADSAFEVELDLLAETPPASPPPSDPPASQHAPPRRQTGPTDGPAWIALLDELDRIVPPVPPGTRLSLVGNPFDRGISIRATPSGLLRLGVAFARGATAPATGKGRNGGARLDLDLGCLVSGLVFECERVDALPLEGDRRRPVETPGCGVALLVLFVVGLAWAMRSCFSAG